jgi:hypothetical protein
MKKNIPNQNI